MRSLLVRNLNKLLILLAVCVSLSALVSLYSFQKEYVRQSTEFRDNFVFYVYQLEREALISQLYLKKYQAETTVENLEVFLEQFDILWSRVASLGRGSLGDEFLLIEDSHSAIAYLKTNLEEADKYIVAGRFSHVDLIDMDAALINIVTRSRELSLEALSVHQDQSRVRRENLTDNYISMIILVLLVTIVGVLTVLYLIMQNKRLKALGRNLEQKVKDRTVDLEQNNEQLRLEIEEKKRVMQELSHSQKVAEQASRAKTQFLANMSHELRTPLNAIIGFADVMKQELWGPIPEKRYVGYVDDIHKSGQHLSNLLKEILDLTKIEAGEVHLERSSVSLYEVLNDVARLSSILRERNKGSLEISDGGSYMLHVDPTMIKQILLNFVSNAFKHAGPECRVQIKYEFKEQFILTVSDNGKGIPQEDCKVILEPFKQSRNTVSIASGWESSGGTGIGLSISLRLAELHGGSIQLDSELGRGTDVTLILPKECVLS